MRNRPKSMTEAMTKSIHTNKAHPRGNLVFLFLRAAVSYEGKTVAALFYPRLGFSKTAARVYFLYKIFLLTCSLVQVPTSKDTKQQSKQRSKRSGAEKRKEEQKQKRNKAQGFPRRSSREVSEKREIFFRE